MTLPNVELRHTARLLEERGYEYNAQNVYDAIETIETLYHALDRLRGAAFAGGLTPDYCAEVVMTALAKVEASQSVPKRDSAET